MTIVKTVQAIGYGLRTIFWRSSRNRQEKHMLTRPLFLYKELLSAKLQPNKRMLSDWFSATLQTSRKCGN